MAVYAIAQFKVTKPELYQRYLDQFMDVLIQYKGKLVAADSGPIVVEGAWDYDKIVVIQFDDADHLGNWANSPEYQEISKDRLAGTAGCVLVVHGVNRNK